MKIIDNLRDFLEDREYYIDIFDDKLHVYNYKKLLKLNSKNIQLKFEKFILDIKGDNLKIIEMNKIEMLIKGIIDTVRIINEK